MLKTLTLKFWEPFFKVAKINGGCPVKIVYGCPEGKTSIIYDDLSKAENVLVYGTTGSGKSVFLHVFIKGASIVNTVEDVRFVLVDSKKIEFNQYKNSELLHCPIINRGDELLAKTKELINECHKRKEVIGDNDFEASRKQNNQHFPYILLVIDEYADIANKELNNTLLELMKDGFKYGIHVVLSTQRISEDNINFFKSFKTIVCQTNYDEKETRALIGDYVELNGGGDSLVLRNGELTRTQGLYTSYNEDLSAKVDECVMSMETWIFEMLAKHNDEILVPVDENNEIIIRKKVVTIYNPLNYVKADIYDKHRKVKMKFWTLLKSIRGKRLNIRLENNYSSYYSCRMHEGWYNQWWKKYKNN